jgi:hypothetical protein
LISKLKAPAVIILSVGVTVFLKVSFDILLPLFTSPAKPGLSLSSVLQQSNFSFWRTGSRSLECDYQTSVTRDLIVRSGANEAMLSGFDHREGKFTVTKIKNELTAKIEFSSDLKEFLPPNVDTTQFVNWEVAHIQSVQLFLQVAYLYGPMPFATEPRTIGVFDLGFRKETLNDEQTLSRNLRTLEWKAKDGASITIDFEPNKAGLLIPTWARFTKPSEEIGWIFKVEYDSNETTSVPRVLHTQFFNVSNSKVVATSEDKFSSCQFSN